MKKLSAVLPARFVIKTGTKPVNLNWEQADEFARYVRLTTPFVMRLFRIFGKDQVLAERSWFKDATNEENYHALAMWHMKQLTKK